MRWLVRDTRRGDSFLFHYSGHGGQTRDLDGDESDGLDEVIYPVDYQENGRIVDDDMHAIMVKSLPPGCSLTGPVRFMPFWDGSRSALPRRSLFAYAFSPLTQPFLPSDQLLMSSPGHPAKTERRARTLPPQISSAVGAMSNAFITILQQTSIISYKDLLRHFKRNCSPDITRNRSFLDEHK
ncbi:hypothetical protein APHAL10511_000348 [Amanita phalloides]|nr:hypothetical protein APHAL10511_000348 [Amanita phalloides]